MASQYNEMQSALDDEWEDEEKEEQQQQQINKSPYARIIIIIRIAFSCDG